MLSTLGLARVKPAFLAVRLRCSIRYSELRYSELHAPCVFLDTQPHAHMPRTSEAPQRIPLNDRHPRRAHTIRCAPSRVSIISYCASLLWASLFCVLFAELYPCVEHTLRCTRCNRFARISQSLSEAGLKALPVDRAVRDQASRSVHHHSVVNGA